MTHRRLHGLGALPGLLVLVPILVPVLILVMATAGGPLAAQDTRQAQPSAAARAFAAFLGQASPLCLRQAARRCVEAGWRFADRDRDARVSPAELETVRRELREWLSWSENGIRPGEKRAVLLGLMVVETLGLARLVDSYDADGDGALDRAELLSDVRLDERPLGEVLSDSEAVDWGSLRTRLGALAPAIQSLAPPPAPAPE